MAEILKQEKLIKSDVGANNNKFWYITLYSDFTVVRENGRVGTTAAVTPSPPFRDLESAEKFFNAELKKKLGDKKGYTKLSVLKGVSEENTNVSLKEQVLSDIETTPEVAQLLKFLTEKNIHSILDKTTLTYDIGTGLFSTPCGIVTQSAIDTARNVLFELSKKISKSDFTSTESITIFQNYLQIIPKKVGRKLSVESVFPNIESIKEEENLLDSLEVSIEQAMKPVTSPSETKVKKKVFDIKINLVDDKSVIDRIRAKFSSTNKSYHESSNFKVKRIFSIDIAHMSKLFSEKSAKYGNINEYWHGTMVHNVLSILKSGLVIPKSAANGRNFGDGVYFSDQSTKSLNYSSGYWYGNKENKCFMFVADVAMGKTCFVTNSVDSKREEDSIYRIYDSITATPDNYWRLKNNEMIVPSLEQINLKYLVEFER